MSEAVVHVTTVVSPPPPETFAIFTEDVDAWWGAGPRFRAELGESGVLAFEPGAGGRLVERYADGSDFALGRIDVWKPGERQVYRMGGRDFGPDEWTTVEITFRSEKGGTRVSVRQTGFEALGAGHPALHGMEAGAFLDMMSVWWADLLVSLGRAKR